MKILLSAYACEPGRGSEPGNGWNWAKSLSILGHDIQLLTRPTGAEATRAEARRLGLPISVHTIEADGLIARGGHYQRVYGHYILWQRAALSYAARMHLDHVDVMHHVSWGSLHFGSQLGSLAAPFVWGPIGGGQTAPQGFESYLGKGRRVEDVRTWLTSTALPLFAGARRTAEQADVCLVSNVDTARAVKQLGAKNVRLWLADAVPDEALIDGPRSVPQEPEVLWVGRMLPRKAVTLVIDIFREVHRQVPEARLTLVGDGPTRSDAEAHVRKLGLEHRVHFRGQLPWPNVAEYYANSRVFLFPSLRDSFGSQVLEAAASGLPTVALNHHGIGDFFPDEAGAKIRLGAPASVIQESADATVRLLLEDSQWLASSNGALEFARRNTWRQRAGDAVRLYGDLGSSR